IGQPVAEERVDVVQEGGRWRERRNVTGPAQALIALRAVGWYVDEIAPHSPDDVVVELVQQRVGGAESSDPFELGTDGHSGQIRRLELARPTRYLGVPEAVEGEGGFELVRFAA